MVWQSCFTWHVGEQARCPLGRPRGHPLRMWRNVLLKDLNLSPLSVVPDIVCLYRLRFALAHMVGKTLNLVQSGLPNHFFKFLPGWDQRCFLQWCLGGRLNSEFFGPWWYLLFSFYLRRLEIIYPVRGQAQRLGHAVLTVAICALLRRLDDSWALLA